MFSSVNPEFRRHKNRAEISQLMNTTITRAIAETARDYVRRANRGVARLDLEDAACREEDQELFFAVGDGREERAKRICRRCEVRWECLTYALDTRQRHGVWGGLTPEERILLVRKVRSEMPQ